MLSIIIPLAALSLAITGGTWAILKVVKRIENAVAELNRQASGTDNSIYTIEAAVKWFLREKNREVVRNFGHYNVQSVCVNCCRLRPENCISCSARRGKDLTLNREDVRWLASELESCTTRLVKEMHDTSKDSVDALALALNIKSGLDKKKKK